MFQLLVEACDNGNPRLCANATVTININRIGVFPVCQYPAGSGSFVNTIMENAAIGSVVLDINALDTDIKVSQGASFQNLEKLKGTVILLL